MAREADVVVAFLGEHEMESGESSSRTDLSMSAAQRQLLEKLLATGKPVVLVYFMGRPTVLDWESRNVPAILNAWFPGSEAGDALADVIFGDVNPSGKLTASFPRSVGQIPIHYDELPTGRRIADGNNFAKFTSSYIDGPSTPLYPFGYGLSYTDFSYSPMKLSSETMAPGDSITVTVGVTNTGARPGDEIVQLYIRDIVGSVSRPHKPQSRRNKRRDVHHHPRATQILQFISQLRGRTRRFRGDGRAKLGKGRNARISFKRRITIQI